jgi:hypothetical protein
MQVKMVMMKESTVIRYLSHATDDMIQNNLKEIRCLCRKCKLRTLFNPFSDKVLEHLLISGFIDGHTQWIGEDADPTKPSRVVMRRGKRNIIGMDGIANEEDFDQYGDPI